MGNLFGEDEVAPSLDEKVAEAEAVIDAADITPRTNPDLLGHGAVEKALLDDFNAGRLPHALILAGPSGIGKATLAYRLARFLFVHGGDEGGLFGKETPKSLHVAASDPVFRRVASGGHADLLVVEREYDEKKDRLKNDISVESVRRVHPFLRKTAAEGGWRVVIVDGAECLNASSQNALLKILEEPPAKTLLILTTAQPGAFLPTIRSRCRLLRMEPPAEEHLFALLDKFEPGLNLNEKVALSRLAQGSLGRALQLKKDGGLTLYGDLLKAASTLPALDAVMVHDLADKIGRYGAEKSYEAAREILLAWCTSAARAEARGEPMQDIMPGDSEVFRRLAASMPPRHFFATREKMEDLFNQTEFSNLDRRQAVLSAFLMLQNPEHQGLSLS